MVGFALETGDAAAKAREKLVRKRLDLVVANDAGEPGAGPEVPTNRVTLVSADGATELPLQGKDLVAEAILDRVAALLASRD
jgi:phosphopantothenoylcysteine decarboxylase/phosphopantothenate--cysteine ligase